MSARPITNSPVEDQETDLALPTLLRLLSRFPPGFEIGSSGSQQGEQEETSMSMDALRQLSMILTLLVCMNCMSGPARGRTCQVGQFCVIAAPSAAFARRVVESGGKVSI